VNASALLLSKTTDYVGNKIYENGVLQKILTDNGYFDYSTNKYYFYTRDHLGNNRIVADQSAAIVQTNQYYPFGMSFPDGTGQDKQAYKFGGKELDMLNGSNLYDFVARGYDPAVGRFMTIDPLAEKYYSVSPYAYCLNNPVKYVDPDGREPDVYLFDITRTPADQAIINAGKLIPTLPNTFQVLAHGAFGNNKSYMRNVVDGKKVEGEAGQIKDADSFDNAFSGNEEWNVGKNTNGFNVILYSCNTGRGQTSLASKLSAEYEKVNVIAPTRQVHLNTKDGLIGVYGTNDDGSQDSGYWLVYQKGKVVEAYDSNWKPGSSTQGHKVDLKDISSIHYNGKTGRKEDDNKTDK
jgi:RHS repeat-associated protein